MKLRTHLQHLAVSRRMANRLSPPFAHLLLWPLPQQQLTAPSWCCAPAIHLSANLMVWGLPLDTNAVSTIAAATLETSGLHCRFNFRGVCMFLYPSCVCLHIKDKMYVKTCHSLWLYVDNGMVSSKTGHTLQSLMIIFSVMWLGKSAILKSDYSWSQWRYFWILSLHQLDCLFWRTKRNEFQVQ